MILREFPPDPRLARDVKLLWTLEEERLPGRPSTERILPDGLVEVVFHFRDPFLMRREGETFARQPPSFAVSMTERFLEMRPSGRSGFVAVRFHPWGARRFFRVPVEEFRDRHLPAEELWGPAASELSEKIAEARSMEERIALVEGFLLDRFDDSPRDAVDEALRWIWVCKGAISVRDLSDRLAVSERWLERHLRAATGGSPKRTIRLARFLSACRELKGGSGNLAWLAHDAGYSDQSHFIKECRQFSGLTPKELLKCGNVSFFEAEER
jgi:AraC-like DNA-binding protein